MDIIKNSPSPSPGDLPNPGIEPGSPAWQTDSLPSEPSGKHIRNSINNKSWKGCGGREPSYTVGGNVSWYSHC